MDNFLIESLLGLYSISSIGPARMRKLISVLGTPQAVLDASARQLIEIEGIDKKTAEKIKAGPDHDFVEKQMEMLSSSNAYVLTFWDDEYPERLKRIFDPPAFLFIKGNRKLLGNNGIGVVGTRMTSGYGKTVTEQLTIELVRAGITIVSGFARGVDTIAHKAAIENKGSTIAVLGNGLDIVYPAENKKLRDSFGEEGLLVSEYPFGTKPDAGNFPKRNRIISGLSLGILITEAGVKSGALLTAMYALDQNREVFAVPGPITSGKSTGTNALLKQGAKLVQNVTDILQELEGVLGNIDPTPVEKKKTPTLEGTAKTIYQLLEAGPMHIDQIAFKADITSSETLSTLLMLELAGHIRQMAGKMFTLS